MDIPGAKHFLLRILTVIGVVTSRVRRSLQQLKAITSLWSLNAAPQLQLGPEPQLHCLVWTYFKWKRKLNQNQCVVTRSLRVFKLYILFYPRELFCLVIIESGSDSDNLWTQWLKLCYSAIPVYVIVVIIMINNNDNDNDNNIATLVDCILFQTDSSWLCHHWWPPGRCPGKRESFFFPLKSIISRIGQQMFF